MAKAFYYPLKGQVDSASIARKERALEEYLNLVVGPGGSLYLPLAGDTMVGNINMGGNNIVGASEIQAATLTNLTLRDDAGTARLDFKQSGDAEAGDINLRDAAQAITLKWDQSDAQWEMARNLLFNGTSPTITGLRYITGGASNLVIKPGGVASLMIQDDASNNRYVQSPSATGDLRFYKADGLTSALLWDQSALAWIFGDRMLVDAGSSSAPGVAFGIDTNTGMRWYAADSLSLVAGSADKLLVRVNDIVPTVPIQSTVNGTVSLPTYSWNDDPNTGVLSYSADQIGFSAAGVLNLRISNGYTYGGTTATGIPAIKTGTAGSATVPVYGFVGDAGTGYGRGSAGQLVMVSGGTTELYLSATQFVVPNVYNDGIAGTANVIVESNGRLRRDTSARKYKSRITYNVDYLADFDLSPAKFYAKSSGRWHFGFVADDFGAQHESLGEFVDGEIENYDTRAVMAIMAAKINRLERLVEAA